MKIFGTALILSLVFFGTAEAKLGQSLQELEAQYGKSTKLPENLKNFALGSECCTFRNQDYLYIIYFFENKAEIMMVHKKNEKNDREGCRSSLEGKFTWIWI
ncbi:MAG: hypothetical protein EBX50_20510 [Chitinophagia bacterium]|nr:hypothetical protein [Chitinophagia bacterium]